MKRRAFTRSVFMAAASLLLMVLTSCFQKPPVKKGPALLDRITLEYSQNVPGCYEWKGAPQAWNPADVPTSPGDALIILDPGHGPLRDDPTTKEDESKKPTGAIAPTSCGVQLNEDQLTLGLSLRLRATLERLGFRVDLTRYGQFGSIGECAGKAIGTSCAKDTDKALRRRSKRVEEILKQHGMQPTSNTYLKPELAYVSIHFNSATASATSGTVGVLYTGTVRGPGNTFTMLDAVNFRKVNKGSGTIHVPTVAKSLPTSLLDYMVASLRSTGALKEHTYKTRLMYWNVDLALDPNNPAMPWQNGYPFAGTSAYPREYPDATIADGPLSGVVKAYYRPPAGNVGTIAVVSGFEPLFRNKHFYDVKKRTDRVSAPNATLEVANLADCDNVVALARSVNRGGDFDAHNTPLDTKDPLDVAAEDIAHGLVEYYESYVPGFKQKACDNLRASDWAGQGWQLPAWCSSTGGGGGGGNAVPDIDNVILDPASAEIPVGQSVSAALTFSNAGNADLSYSVTADIPQVSITGASSGTVAPGASVSVGVSYSCKPDEPGRFEGAISISSNDPDESTVFIGVSVECVAPQIKVKELLTPYVTAFNFVDDPGDNFSHVNVHDTFDFYEVSGKANLEFTLELPDWLYMPSSGVLPPGGAYSDVFAEYRYGMKMYTHGPEALCNGAQEREDVIVIHSNDPVRPRIEVPVRLMCPEMEVTISPDVYNEPGTPIERRCIPASGKIVIRGAEHFQEIHARVEDTNGSSTVSYIPPLITYKLHLRAMQTRLRWPYFHSSSSIYEPWSWNQYPELPFVTWIGTCSMQPGSQTIDKITLRNPLAVERPEIAYPTDILIDESAYEFTVADSNLPGIVYNGSGKKAKLKFYAMFGITPEQVIVLPPSGTARVWHWLRLHKFRTWLWDEDEQKWIEGEIDYGGHDAISFNEQMRCRYLPISYVLDGSGTPGLDVGGQGYLWAFYIGGGGSANFTTPNMECYDHPEDLPPWWNGREPERKPSSVRQ